MPVVLLVLCLALPVVGQQLPDPPLALVGGDVILAAGDEPLEGATVLVRDGLVEAVGVAVAIPDDARVVDATGYTLAPSFVDAAHELDLDFGAHDPNPGRSADDGRDVFAGMLETNRRGIAPERRAARALAADAAKRSAHREQGFGALLVAPSGMALSGTGAWLLPDDRPPREALFAVEVADFGSLGWRASSGYEGTDYPATLMGLMAHLRQALLDAEHHAALQARFREGRSARRPPVDPTLDALQAVLAGERPLVLHADEEEDIRLALGLAEQFTGLRLVIAGGREAWEVADLLAAREVPVILDLDFGEEPEKPASEDDGIDLTDADAHEGGDDPAGDEEPRASAEGAAPDAPADDEAEEAEADETPAEAGEPKRPGPWDPGTPPRLVADRHARWVERVSCAATLVEAGVPVAFGTFGRSPKELRAAVRSAVDEGGLAEEDALRILTAGAADVLGGAAPVGRLEAGAHGNVTGWAGSPTAKKSKVAFSVVGGVLFDDRDDVPPPDADDAADEDDDAEGDDDDTDDDAADEAVARSDDDAPRRGRRGGRRGGRGGRGGRPDAADDDTKDDDEAADEGDPAETAWQRAVAALLEAADAEVHVPVELDEDREPSFRTGGDVLVRGATILTVDERQGVLEDADLLVSDGTIAAIGQDLVAPEGVHVVDGAGLFVAPGIIDCHAHVAIRGGINEWTRILTPEVTIEDEVDPDDVGIYRALAGGTTSARLLHGSANSIGGRHEVVKFRWGASAPEMVLEGAPRGVKFALGENPRQANWGSGDRFPKTRMGVEVSLRRGFEAARRYRESRAAYDAAVEAGDDPDPPRRDLRLEALAGILDGEIAVHSHCYRAHEILMLIRIAEEFGFSVATFQHVLEGYKVAAEIAAHEGGLGGSTFVDWWGFKYEATEATPYNAALVHEAGGLMSVNSDSGDHIRRLNLEAAKTVKYGGVPEREALAMVTLNPALQLGIDGRVGSLEPGKDADFAVYSGHPFDVTSRVLMTFVDGEVVFERREGVYDAWMDEVARRVEAARPVLAEGPPRTRLLEGRGVAVDPAVVDRMSTPRRGTRAPSTPERPAPQPVVLVGGRVHTMRAGADGALVVHDPGVVMLRDGRIEAVQAGGADVEALRASGYDVRDVSGLDVWPGMIDTGAPVGLGEISLVRQSMDVSEVGGDQADIRASTAWHPSSAQIPVARVNGVTAALVAPGGRGIAGQSALMALEGWTVSDALVRDAAALHLSAPRTNRDPRAEETVLVDGCMGGLDTPLVVPMAGRGDEEPLDDRVDDAWRALREVFDEAREYARLAGVLRTDGRLGEVFDPRLEALAPFVLGEAPVVFDADRADQIADVLDFADDYGLDVVIAGGREAWKVADRLALGDVPVLVGPVTSLPSARHDPYDATYSNAGLLHRAGVRIAFRTDSAFDARNLPYQAGMAAAFGLPEDAAMVGLTSGAADALGLGDELGSLAPGLRADVFVTNGSPLQITTRVRQVFVGGRDVGLESLHTELYETWRDRLHDPGRAYR